MILLELFEHQNIHSFRGRSFHRNPITIRSPVSLLASLPPILNTNFMPLGRLSPARLMRSMTNIISVDPKWYGAVDVVIAAPLDKAWEIASDWLNFPSRCSVECMQGVNGVPGCVRKVRPHADSRHWVAEKLTHIDHIRHVLAYDLVGGNTGILPGYQAAFQVIQSGRGTRVVWPFRFNGDQDSVDSIAPLVMAKLTNYVKELEELARQ